jgi:putative membrane protein
MVYFFTVTLHLVAMVAWMAPMIAVPAILSGYGRAGPSPHGRERLRAAFRGLATPGLVLTWLLGIANAVQGDWFDDGWLHVKLVFVLALSALHGVLSARLREIEMGGGVPAFVRNLHWVVLGLLFGAILLAEWKPF